MAKTNQAAETNRSDAPTKPKRQRQPTIWDECRAFERKHRELHASMDSHTAKALEFRDRIKDLIAGTSDEVLQRCSIKRPGTET